MDVLDDREADAALDAFFEEDALLEALQDAPDFEEQAEAFKVPGSEISAVGSKSRQPGETSPRIAPQIRTARGPVQRAAMPELSSSSRLPQASPSSTDDRTSKPRQSNGNAEASQRRLPRSGKGSQSWRGTMVVILTSLIIWATLLTLWGPDELMPAFETSSFSPKEQSGRRKSWKAIQLPGWSLSGIGSEEASVPVAAARGRVDVSWSSYLVSNDTAGTSNASETGTMNRSTEGVGPPRMRRKSRYASDYGMQH
eukprot:TRINITY_DN53769_c0_g1_i1.p1 TRINITY_DN53769_c0_g1~~TRINITY_DN53769_c0_g1_i1.p1  ORF type:complete len:255 (-),score=48.78 TRINITY_DN53769_c0_g1_i1:20-784(-)